jgi:predicted RNase H-like HicB family nuclease
MFAMRYAIVIERAAPISLPMFPIWRCVATASTQNEVETLLREAIELHIAGMREDNQPIPEPSSSVDYLEVEVAAT